MKTVSYYFTPASPWTYLGHARFVEMAKRHGATVRLRPVDLGRVFPVSGGLPLAKRAPQRQAYRLHELARWRDAVGVPLTIHPKFFPVPADLAALTIIAADLAAGTDAALGLAGAVGTPSRQRCHRGATLAGLFGRVAPVERRRVERPLSGEAGPARRTGWPARAPARPGWP
jgi:hypothetical protein